jgi:beta-glucanase (GH16 family)
MLLAVVFIAFASTVTSQVQARKFAFSDEFNGPAGSPIDSAKWTAETGGWGWGNQELQFYTDSTENVYQDGSGFLVIKARKETPPLTRSCWYGPCGYTSARVITKQKFDRKYGRFEARIKIPGGNGLWPAFCLLGSDIDEVGWPQCGEIDIMENIGREPTTVHGTMHGPGYNGANGIGSAFSFSDQRRIADGFHVFTLEWNENKISWYVDGVLYQTRTPADLPQGTEWVHDHPFFVILNVAVGGGWPGSPDETTVFPQTMLVDYIRVHNRSAQ